MAKRSLTLAASEAVRCVLRGGAGGPGPIAAERMVLCLVRQPECEAVLVLRHLGVPVDDIRAGLEPRMPARSTFAAGWGAAAESLSFYRLAVEEAERLRDRDIGTDHLLLAIAREQDGQPEWPLSVDYRQIVEGVTALREARRRGEAPARAADDLPFDSRPSAVSWAALWLILQALCSCRPLSQLAFVHPLALPLMLWSLVTVIVLPVALFQRKRWAWAASILILGERVASSAAVTLAGAFSYPRTAPSAPALIGLILLLELIWILIAAGAMAGLTRSARWFGVDRRRRWFTLRREGGWALAVALVLDGLFLGSALMR